MYRKLSTAILIALIALMTVHSAYASESHGPTAQTVNVFLGTFDAEANTFIGAFDAHDGSGWHAITWQTLDGSQSREDDMGDVSSTDIYTVEFTLDSSFSYDHGMLVNNLTFLWTYADDTDIGTVANVRTHDGITDGTVNGDYAQFNDTSVQDGAIFLLRESNPFTAQDARGWFTQNGMLHSFVVGNGESMPQQHKLYIAIVL